MRAFLPLLVEALERGNLGGIPRLGRKARCQYTPIPRYDLLDLGAYLESAVFARLSVQCEFCDIIVLYM